MMVKRGVNQAGILLVLFRILFRYKVVVISVLAPVITVTGVSWWGACACWSPNIRYRRAVESREVGEKEEEYK